MRIERRFTKPGQSPYAEIDFRKAVSEIKNPDGSIVFRLADIDVPAQFSQVATDVLAQKYFRKAGVPKFLKKVEENDVPFRPSGRHLGLLGLEGQIFLVRRRCAGLPR